jgi:hypothetical protein
MQPTTEPKILEGIQGSTASTETGEGTRFYQGRVLDELPGAVFAAVTLIWIMASFSRLIW